MKRRIILIGILFVLIIESVFVYNLFKPNKSQILENIKTVDIFDNKDKTISIMVQDPKTYEYKSDTSRTSWPQKTEYMYAGTKCTDASGKDVGDTTAYLKFDESDYTATITTKKTIYCTLYFANGRPALEVLKAKGGDYYAGGGEHITAVNGLYRFKGTYQEVTNNYICLGSENPDTCKANKENMYRIIGVTDGTERTSLDLEEGMLKVIKAISPQRGYWAYQDENIDWDNSWAVEYLNNSFLSGQSVNTRIKDFILEVKWYKGYNGQGYPSTNPETPTSELLPASSSHKVGLMYASDYYHSWTYVSSPGNTNSWLNICHGLSSGSPICGSDSWNNSNNEWTMTKYGYNYNTSRWAAYLITASGYMYPGAHEGNQSYIRPVFYLSNSIGLIGEGTENIPYTVTTIK